MHADRTNRTMLIVFALVLIAVGGVGIAATFGVFGTGFEHRALLDNSVAHYIGRSGKWLWPVAAVVALVIGLLSARWLFAILFTSDRAPDLAVPGGGGSGASTLAPGALTSAVTREIDAMSGVDSSNARVIGDADEPQLVIGTSVHRDVDLIDLRRRIIDGPIAHARQAVGNDEMPVRLDLVVSKKTVRRVS